MASVTHYTTEPQLVVPSAADGVTLTPASVAFNNSVWVQLTAGISEDIVVVGFAVHVGTGAQHNIDLGVGAVSSEVVVGTIQAGGEGAIGNYPAWRFLIPIEIAKDQRLSVRLRKEGGSVAVWRFKLLYYELIAAVAAVDPFVSVRRFRMPSLSEPRW